jgi:hypothetical protein
MFLSGWLRLIEESYASKSHLSRVKSDYARIRQGRETTSVLKRDN